MQLIAQLETIWNNIPTYPNRKGKVEKKWSDIVASTNPKAPKPNPAAIYNIEMVITSKPSHLHKEACGTKAHYTTQSSIVRKDKKNYRDRRP